MYETICSPLNYGGLTLKNRIVFAPTSLGLPQEELVERLKKIDDIAYIRFASVYRQFRDIDSLNEEVSKLISEKKG